MASELTWFPLALLSAAFAALTAVFAIMFLGEKSTVRRWLAIGLVSAGIVLPGRA
jgi:uncharacterized membrane protein